MEVHLSPEVQEMLKSTAARQGIAADDLAREVLTNYLADEARLDQTVDSWSDEERLAVMARIEESYLQSERGEVMSAEEARRDMEAMKAAWRQQRDSGR